MLRFSTTAWPLVTVRLCAAQVRGPAAKRQRTGGDKAKEQQQAEQDVQELKVGAGRVPQAWAWGRGGNSRQRRSHSAQQP